MKKQDPELDDDPLDHEIDLTNVKWRRNPFAADFRKFRNWVFIDPPMLEHFPDTDAVNAALRELLALRAKATKRAAKTATAPRTAAKKK